MMSSSSAAALPISVETSMNAEAPPSDVSAEVMLAVDSIFAHFALIEAKDPLILESNVDFPLARLLWVYHSRPNYSAIEAEVERRLTARHFKSLETTQDQADQIEKAPQRDPLWFLGRKLRLTASVAGCPAGHNSFDKQCKSLMATLIWNKRFVTSAACQWGIDLEPVARDGYEDFMRKWRNDPSIKVTERGFFVAVAEPWFGYSPDGFVSSIKEPALTAEQEKAMEDFDPASQAALDAQRQKPVLPLKQARGGTMSTCIDGNDHPDKKWIQEPIFEVFFDNATLEIVPFASIPDDCFARAPKQYGKKTPASTGPPVDWPSPPVKATKTSTNSSTRSKDGSCMSMFQ
jgi:hypothetical protein